MGQQMGTTFSQKKSAALVIAAPDCPPQKTWKLQGGEIKQTEHSRYLGAIMNNKGQINLENIKARAKTARIAVQEMLNRGIRALSIDGEAVKKLSFAPIQPILGHGMCFIPNTGKALDMLDVEQGKLIKELLNVTKHASTTAALAITQWLPIRYNVITERARLYKSVHNGKEGKANQCLLEQDEILSEQGTTKTDLYTNHVNQDLSLIHI